MKQSFNFIFILFVFFIAFFQISFALDATVVYASTSGNGINCPKIRNWNSSSNSWGSEVELTCSSAQITSAKIYFSSVNQKRIIVTQNINGEIDIYVSWNGSDWVRTANITDLWVTAPTTYYRGFDLAFESATGNAILVASVVNTSTSCDVGYFIIPANSTTINSSSYGCINDNTVSTDITSRFVFMSANPNSSSREIIMGTTETNQDDVNFWVWNGSTWGNQKEVAAAATATADREAAAIAYTSSGQQAMAVAGDGTVGNVNYSYWNGSAWSTTSYFDIDTADSFDVYWATLYPNWASNSNYLIGTFVDSGEDLTFVVWNGSSWYMVSNVDTGLDASATRCADAAFTSSSEGKSIRDTDTTGSVINVRNYSISTGLLATENTYSTYPGTGAWLRAFQNPNSSDTISLFVLRMNNSNSTSVFYFNGTAFSQPVTLAASAQSSNYESFWLGYIKAYDTSPPTIENASINQSVAPAYSYICFKINIVDQYGAPISSAYLNVTYPNGTSVLYSLSNSECNPSNSPTIFGVQVPTGSDSGTLYFNSVSASDVYNNTDSSTFNLNATIQGVIVDISISSASLTFGSLDPGTNDNAATNNPITITNTANSNTAVDIYLNNSNMTSGSYTMPASALSVWTSNTPASSVNFNGANWLNGSSANQGFIENLAVNNNVNLYFWHDVPSGQYAGTYTATVTVHAVADGQAP
jgi:hypothetical protein